MEMDGLGTMELGGTGEITTVGEFIQRLAQILK
jgi:hypothetical protein